jgi:transcriptional regulator GlxA family with amidase domain
VPAGQGDRGKAALLGPLAAGAAALADVEVQRRAVHAQRRVVVLGDLPREDSIHPPPGPVDAALHEITHAIRQDPSRRWTVAELAERTALSRAQFTRRFTAHTGMSPIRYLIEARIDRARQLLTETKTSVTHVALTLGYTDIGYFSRQFKRHTGHSPSRAR